VTTATRSAALPDVPTIGEFVPGYEASAVGGIGVPKGTPKEIVGKLNAEINTALADPKMNDRIKLFWVATGKDDFVLPSTKAALALLDQHKIRYSFKETEGAHTWPNWRAYLNEFAPLLFR